MRHGYGRTIVDSYIEIPQRNGTCQKCGSTYSGPKKVLPCKGCGNSVDTHAVACAKKVPAGTWTVTTQKQAKPKG